MCQGTTDAPAGGRGLRGQKHGLRLHDTGDVLPRGVVQIGLHDDCRPADVERPGGRVDVAVAHCAEEVRLRLDRCGSGRAVGEVEERAVRARRVGEDMSAPPGGSRPWCRGAPGTAASRAPPRPPPRSSSGRACPRAASTTELSRSVRHPARSCRRRDARWHAENIEPLEPQRRAHLLEEPARFLEQIEPPPGCRSRRASGRSRGGRAQASRHRRGCGRWPAPRRTPRRRPPHRGLRRPVRAQAVELGVDRPGVRARRQRIEGRRHAECGVVISGLDGVPGGVRDSCAVSREFRSSAASTDPGTTSVSAASGEPSSRSGTAAATARSHAAGSRRPRSRS